MKEFFGKYFGPGISREKDQKEEPEAAAPKFIYPMTEPSYSMAAEESQWFGK